MAFSASNLSMLVTANAFQLWQYKSSADTLATIMAANYFNGANDELRVGDLIIVRDSGDLTSLIRVVSNDGTTVVVARDAAYEKQVANPDTSGLAVAALETEVNEVKAALRAVGIITT